MSPNDMIRPADAGTIAAHVADQHGGTFDRNGWPVTPTDGYAVGVAPETAAILPADVTPERMRESLLRTAQEWESRFVGVWVMDSGEYAIDPVRILTQKHAALDLAREKHQIAIWGFAEHQAFEA